MRPRPSCSPTGSCRPFRTARRRSSCCRAAPPASPMPKRTAACCWTSSPAPILPVVLAIARVIVENGWEDEEWIKNWVNNKWESSSGFGQGTRNTPWQWRTTWGKFQTKGFEDWKKWLLAQDYCDAGKGRRDRPDRRAEDLYSRRMDGQAARRRHPARRPRS